MFRASVNHDSDCKNNTAVNLSYLSYLSILLVTSIVPHPPEHSEDHNLCKRIKTYEVLLAPLCPTEFIGKYKFQNVTIRFQNLKPNTQSVNERLDIWVPIYIPNYTHSRGCYTKLTVDDSFFIPCLSVKQNVSYIIKINIFKTDMMYFCCYVAFLVTHFIFSLLPSTLNTELSMEITGQIS